MSLPEASPPSRQAIASDVIQFYRLVHDREPESDEVINGFVGMDLDAVATAFFSSGEFIERVIGSADRGENIWDARRGPPQMLVDWAIETLPFSEPGRATFRAWSDSWPGSYFALLSDEGIRSTVAEATPVSPVVLSRFKAFAGLIWGVERLDSSVVSGWIMARGPDAEPISLEIWGGGALVAAGRADRFRRDIQDRFGGDGRVGFEIRLAPRRRQAGPLRIEVRIASTGERIAEGDIHSAPVITTGLNQLRAEIAEVRATLERLERALPAITSGLGRALDDYADYFEDWGRRPTVIHDDDLAVTVVVDAVGAEPLALDHCTRSIRAQLGRRDRMVLLIDQRLVNTAAEIANRAAWRNSTGISWTVVESQDAGARLQVALHSDPGSDVVILTQADAVLAGDALALITAAFAGSPELQAVYADEDRLDPDDDSEVDQRRHVSPILRPGYDRDLLLQIPYIGTTLGFRRSVFNGLEPAEGCGGLHGCDLVLRLGDAPGVIGHVASVIAARATDPGLDPEGVAWAECVRREVVRSGRAIEILPKSDILGAVVPGAIRLRYEAAPIRVSIIIPTRDRLDLLRPCVDSILRHRGDNRAKLDLIIIDHESREPETRGYLDRLVEQGEVSVVPFAGVFNWALMNNLAAATATGEVLIFLNNDTVVLSPDWVDELAGQALRPEVGVVGARLLYGDGTIQHAGFVSRDANKDFLIHDGVGIAGSDGGYLGRHALLHASPVVTGACMAVRTEVFRALGGFDAANFPLEGNDADLCYRARAEGLSVIYDPYATLYHLESKSRGFSVSGEDRAASLAAQALLRRRWGERFGEDAGFNPHFDRTGRPFDRLRPPPADFLLA